MSSESRRVERVSKRKKPTGLAAFLPRGFTIKSALTGIIIGVIGFGVVGLIVALSFYGYFQMTDRIIMGVSVGSIDLSNRTLDEATAMLANEWRGAETLQVSDGDRTWISDPATFGLHIDPASTARRALDIGHGQSFANELSALITGLTTGYPVAPVIIYDEAAARNGMNDLADQVYVEPTNATVTIQDGVITPIAGVPGKALDVDASLRVLADNPEVVLYEGTLPLITHPVAPEIADASAVVAEAERLLASPLAVSGYDAIQDRYVEWTVPPLEVSNWLTISEDDSGPHLNIDDTKLADYLAGLKAGSNGIDLTGSEIVDEEESGPIVLDALENATVARITIRHAPTTYTVQAGDTLTRVAWNTGIPYWRVLNANPDIDADHLLVGQVINIPSLDDLLPLPIVPGKRIVVSISQQHLWAYENGALVRDAVISTGITDSPTQPGVFQVQLFDPYAYASAWNLYMPDFIGIYEAWPGFMNGFHGLPLRDGTQLLWQGSLGSPVSYGCIILGTNDSEWLYNWADAGVVVEIQE